jgi:peptide/nickel transport system permease protein
VAGPLVNPHGPNEYVGPPSQRPSAAFWFGTTMFGQDVFAQFAHGLRATFLVGLLGGGLAALLGMLNSCAVGVAVVNIDNGFGAGALAARILSSARREPAP